MDAGVACVLILVAFVGFIGVIAWWGSEAKKQQETVVKISRQRAIDAVEQSFNGLLWADVDGPGVINKRRRAMRGDGPTISVDFDEAANGGVQVSTWMSAWVSQMGLANFPLAAIRQKKKLLARVEAAAGS